jgi:hypothetical protein
MRIVIDDALRARARELYPKGLAPETAYLGEEALVSGAFGEAAFERAIEILELPKPEYVGSQRLPWDFIGEPYGRVDVKTKPRSVPPRVEYEAGIAAEQLAKSDLPDVFVFVSLYPKAARPGYYYEEAWIVGYMPVERFKKFSHLVPAGSPMGNGTSKSWRDMHDVKLGQLWPIEWLVPFDKREGNA